MVLTAIGVVGDGDSIAGGIGTSGVAAGALVMDAITVATTGDGAAGEGIAAVGGIITVGTVGIRAGADTVVIGERVGAGLGTGLSVGGTVLAGAIAPAPHAASVPTRTQVTIHRANDRSTAQFLSVRGAFDPHSLFNGTTP